MQGFNSLLPSSTTWQSFLTSVKRMELSLFESAGKLKKGAKDYEEQNFDMKKWCISNNSPIHVLFTFCKISKKVLSKKSRMVFWNNPPNNGLEYLTFTLHECKNNI